MNAAVMFIGGGNMATAMIGGLVRAQGDLDIHDIHVVETSADARARLATSFARQTRPLRIHASLTDALGSFAGTPGASGATDASDATLLMVLAVKPQQARQALEQAAPFFAASRKARVLLLSIAAGIEQASLREWSGGHELIARAMPNTPALIGEGVAGLWMPGNFDDPDRALIRSVLAGTGSVVEVDDESKLHAVTAISGSGPAYVFYLMEAMEKAARELGLDEAASRQLILGTVRGAALLAAQSEDAPAELRRKVTSPKGTTQAAIESMESDGVGARVAKALRAAHARSEALSRGE